MSAHRDETPEPDPLLPPVHFATREESRQMFENRARYALGMSGAEFKRKWESGEFGDIERHPDYIKIMLVAALLPWAE